MGLHKGAKPNNPTGRPVGSKNHVTQDLRKRINDFLNDNWESLQEDFEQLEPKDKLLFYEKLLQYGLPKMQSTQLTVDVEVSKTDILKIFPMDEDIEALDDAKLDNVIDNIRLITDE